MSRRGPQIAAKPAPFFALDRACHAREAFSPPRNGSSALRPIRQGMTRQRFNSRQHHQRLSYVTGFAAGLTGAEQILIGLQEMMRSDGQAEMPQIYEAVDAEMSKAGF